MRLVFQVLRLRAFSPTAAFMAAKGHILDATVDDQPAPKRNRSTDYDVTMEDGATIKPEKFTNACDVYKSPEIPAKFEGNSVVLSEKNPGNGNSVLSGLPVIEMDGYGRIEEADTQTEDSSKSPQQQEGNSGFTDCVPKPDSHADSSAGSSADNSRHVQPLLDTPSTSSSSKSETFANACDVYGIPGIPGKFEKNSEVLSEEQSEPGASSVVRGLHVDDGYGRIEEDGTQIEDSSKSPQQQEGNSGFTVCLLDPKSHVDSSAGNSADNSGHAQPLPDTPSTRSSSKSEKFDNACDVYGSPEIPGIFEKISKVLSEEQPEPNTSVVSGLPVIEMDDTGIDDGSERIEKANVQIEDCNESLQQQEGNSGFTVCVQGPKSHADSSAGCSADNIEHVQPLPNAPSTNSSSTSEKFANACGVNRSPEIHAKFEKNSELLSEEQPERETSVISGSPVIEMDDARIDDGSGRIQKANMQIEDPNKSPQQQEGNSGFTVCVQGPKSHADSSAGCSADSIEHVQPLPNTPSTSSSSESEKFANACDVHGSPEILAEFENNSEVLSEEQPEPESPVVSGLPFIEIDDADVDDGSERIEKANAQIEDYEYNKSPQQQEGICGFTVCMQEPKSHADSSAGFSADNIEYVQPLPNAPSTSSSSRSEKFANACGVNRSPEIHAKFEKNSELLSEEQPDPETSVISGSPVIEMDDARIDDGSGRIQKANMQIEDPNKSPQQQEGNSGFTVCVQEPKSHADSSAGCSADNIEHVQPLPDTPSTSSSSRFDKFSDACDVYGRPEILARFEKNSEFLIEELPEPQPSVVSGLPVIEMDDADVDDGTERIEKANAQIEDCNKSPQQQEGNCEFTVCMPEPKSHADSSAGCSADNIQHVQPLPNTPFNSSSSRSDKFASACDVYGSPEIHARFEKNSELLSEEQPEPKTSVISGLPVIKMNDADIDDGSERIKKANARIEDYNKSPQQQEGNLGFTVRVPEPKSHADSSAGCSADNIEHVHPLPNTPPTSSSSKAELQMIQKIASTSEKILGSSKSNDPCNQENDIVRILTESDCRSFKIESFALSLGRPTPILLSSDIIRHPASGIKISLSKYTYEKVPWLAGSKSTGKYSCWPCLLFSPEGKWSCLADTEWGETSEAILNHQKTSGHIKAFKKLKQRERLLDIPNPAHPQSAPRRMPDKNGINRRFFELLFRILCLKKTRSQNTDMDFEGYEELMKVAISHDPELTACYEKQFSEHSLVDFVSFHAEKLLKSTVSVIRSSIKKDIISAPYLSLVYEDTENFVDRVSIVAVIVRYVDGKGDIRERFLKFVKLSGIRTSENIYEVHKSLMDEWGLQNKLIGFSYSGTVVVPFGIVALNDAIRILSPASKYFHWPDHNLKEVLLQSLSHVEQSKEFFYVLNNLKSFFSSNSGAIPTLVNLVKTSDPKCPWLYCGHNFTHGLIQTIKYSYPLVLQFFERVSKKFWNDEVVRQVPQFVAFMTKHKNKFLIGLVAAVLSCVDQLSSLMERNFEPHNYKQAAVLASSQLQSMKKLGAEPFMFTASDPNLCTNDSKVIHPELPINVCIELFDSIIDTAINCVNHRCLLDTFFMGNPSAGFADVVKDGTVMSRYAAVSCGTEIAALNEQIDSFKAYELMFHGKNLAEHIAHMTSLKMTEDFLELHKFLHFSILVAPPKQSSDSIITKFKAYMKDKQRFSTSQLFLFLEKESISQLLKNNKFFDDVIDHYSMNNDVAISPSNEDRVEH